MRLDKYLAGMSVGTRSEVRKIIKSGRVFVQKQPVLRPEYQVGESDVVELDGERIVYTEYEYFMMNKPQGRVCATSDSREATVVELLHGTAQKDLFPVGRLDKDTEGLLLLTNDGELAHRLLSPARHVWKKYLVQAEGQVNTEDVRQLEAGVDIGEEKLTLPARVNLLSVEEGGQTTWLEISIREGRYHQIKRMMAKVGKRVLYLKRLSMGSLQLDESLQAGEYRALTEQEVQELRQESGLV